MDILLIDYLDFPAVVMEIECLFIPIDKPSPLRPQNVTIEQLTTQVAVVRTCCRPTGAYNSRYAPHR